MKVQVSTPAPAPVTKAMSEAQEFDGKCLSQPFPNKRDSGPKCYLENTDAARFGTNAYKEYCDKDHHCVGVELHAAGPNRDSKIIFDTVSSKNHFQGLKQGGYTWHCEEPQDSGSKDNRILTAGDNSPGIQCFTKSASMPGGVKPIDWTLSRANSNCDPTTNWKGHQSLDACKKTCAAYNAFVHAPDQNCKCSEGCKTFTAAQGFNVYKKAGW